ncbi:MAG: glycosyltransferase family 2 protein [Deltaproteobacteria bacterium]|nr:glycosyltransferase family 2 protein [Deltaproteobacteria bacterium]MBW2419315.1 glycosyltransferase family 2 protein [Deltaproteobacteria bacterium]
MQISVVIPFYNEVDNVDPVLDELRELLPDAEVIAIDDGSRDGTGERLRARGDVQSHFFPRNLGQSAAVYYGLVRATGDVCVIMDGDGQNDPRDLPRLLELIPDYDLVNGHRAERRDPLSKRLASRVANGFRRAVLHDGMRDTGCTPKLLKRELVRHLVPFDGMHRFIPALVQAAGARCIEVPVQHRPRRSGQSKYTNLRRAVRGLRDVFGVRWLLARRVDWPGSEDLPD